MGCLNSVRLGLGMGRKVCLKFAKNHGWFYAVNDVPYLC